MPLKTIAKYYHEKRKFEKNVSVQIPFPGFLAEFGDWKKYRKRASGPLLDRVPWITFGAAKFLRQAIHQDMSVFEWGMGASSAFLLDLGVDLVSVEHDREWFEKARSCLGENPKWQPNLREPEIAPVTGDPSIWSEYSSSFQGMENARFDNYVKLIDQYEDQSFDLILVDGRSRPACFHHALPKLRGGGYILWDNTDRQSYQREFNSVDLSRYKMFDFPGPSPYVTSFTRTTIWQLQE